ncbi:MAG: type II secretion system F family protein [Acidimicrobiales bacterium]
MRRLAGLGLAVLLGVLPGAASAAAQLAPGPAPATVTAVDASGFPRVTATVSVPPALASRTLPAEAFTVIENGRTLVPAVSPLPADQLEVVLVIDTSGSMRGQTMEAAKRSAVAFLTAMAPTTRIAVVGFGASPVLASGFSLDRAALAGAVNGLVARGETALYDAVAAAVALFPSGSGSYRSIVLLSDGGDTASRTSLEAVTATVTASGVRVAAVELPSSESNSAALARLVAGGSGRVVPAGDPASLEAVYSGIAAALSNQYLLSFESTASGPTGVRVTIVHEGYSAAGNFSFDAPPTLTPAPAQAPAPAAPPPPATPRTDPPLEGSQWLMMGSVAFFAALGLIGLVAFIPRRRRTGRSALGGAVVTPTTSAPAAISGLAHRASRAAEGALERRGKRGALNTALELAGVSLRPGEFMVVVGCAALTMGLAGLLLSGLPAGMFGALLVGGGARYALRFMARRRQTKFAGQLSDTLQLMGGSLRAGYGLLQAFDAMAREAPSPTSEECRRVVVESRLGRSLPESLHAMSTRLASQDFEWVVEAIEINREVGGDLAEVLDRVGNTIRERDFIRRQVKALSAEGRLSGYVLMALPVGLSLMIRMRNPSYFAELTQGVGLLLSGFAIVLMIVGGVWLKKVCRIAF